MRRSEGRGPEEEEKTKKEGREGKGEEREREIRKRQMKEEGIMGLRVLFYLFIFFSSIF